MRLLICEHMTTHALHYPIFCKKVGEGDKQSIDSGVCICGTGVESTTLSTKFHSIRSALVRDMTTERFTPKEELNA